MPNDHLTIPADLVGIDIKKKAVELFCATDSAKLGYLCRICATILEGEWPEHHIATINLGKCDICQQEECLASASDWQLDEDGKKCKVSIMEWD